MADVRGIAERLVALDPAMAAATARVLNRGVRGSKLTGGTIKAVRFAFELESALAAAHDVPVKPRGRRPRRVTDAGA